MGATRPGDPLSVRRPRADAERNRLRLLETAKAVFAEKGSGASLDEIARAAGVGAGTLYRHFPNRDALVAAVYRNESEQLVAAAERLAQAYPPAQALREWLLLFVDFIAAKHGMSEVLDAIVGGTADLYSASTARVTQAANALAARATASGEIRFDLDPVVLLRACGGVASLGAGPNGEQDARRLVDILMAGIRAEP